MQMMQMTTIPRTLVCSWLQLARLPLTVAEKVVRRDPDRADWPPTLLFEGFEASVKQLAGGVLRDDELVREATVQQARLDHLRQAATLKVEAEQRRAEADEVLESRREANAERRQAVEEQADQRAEALARQQAADERKARDQLQAKQAAAAKAEQAQRKAVTTRERTARKVEVAAEQVALDETREAVEARAEVIEVDRELERTKARRKSG